MERRTAVARWWFVPVVFGVLLAGALPFYRLPGASCAGVDACGVPLSSPEGVMRIPDLAHPGWLQAYAVAALAVGGALLAWWYRRAGAAARALPGLLAAAAVAGATALLTAAGWNGFRVPSAVVESAALLVFNGGTPLLVTAFGLLGFAAAERSAGLLVAAVGYAVAAYYLTTWDAFQLLSRIGLPVDVMADPSGVRQLTGIALAAGLLLLTGAAAVLWAGTAGRRRAVS